MDWDQIDEAFTGQPITAADVFAALIVIAVGLAASWLLGRSLRRIVGRPGGQYQQLEKLAGRVVQWVVIAISVAWALSILGLDIGWFSLFVLLGLLIAGVGLKPLVESFASSVLIASRPAFGVGDEICVDDVVGEVIEITERSVVLRRRDGVRVHVPNGDVLTKMVTVYSTRSDRRSVVDVKLAVGTDIDQADRVIRDALDDVQEITRVGAVWATSLESCVGMSVRFWHSASIEAGQRATDAVIRALQRAFESAEIRGAPSIEVQILGSELGIARAPAAPVTEAPTTAG